tara:strand:- start:10 stop:210 length:201 start_codon:yes stop_codon:yes gene_type:complete
MVEPMVEDVDTAARFSRCVTHRPVNGPRVMNGDIAGFHDGGDAIRVIHKITVKIGLKVGQIIRTLM